MFRTGGESMVWDDAKHEWNVKLHQATKGDPSKAVNLSADFVVITPGEYASDLSSKFGQCLIVIRSAAQGEDP